VVHLCAAPLCPEPDISLDTAVELAHASGASLKKEGVTDKFIVRQNIALTQLLMTETAAFKRAALQKLLAAEMVKEVSLIKAVR
jgi:glutamine phosphoribosylpyrophosphate amidotransferase